MSRPSVHETWLQVADVLAARGTCARRRVGCVLVSADGQVLSTGYNGPAPGQHHCTEVPCAGAGLPSGTGLDLCEAIHAEQNALISCPDFTKVHTVYSTAAPCVHCTKMLLRTPARAVYFIHDYPHMAAAQALWTRDGRTWESFSSPVINRIRQFNTLRSSASALTLDQLGVADFIDSFGRLG